MSDERVREVQEWLNDTYSNFEGWVQIAEDGYTRRRNCYRFN